MSAAAKVRALRKELGLSQTAFAHSMRRAGASSWRQTTVSRVEEGSQELRLRDVIAIKAAFGHDLTADERSGPTWHDGYRAGYDKALRDAVATLKGMQS